MHELEAQILEVLGDGVPRSKRALAELLVLTSNQVGYRLDLLQEKGLVKASGSTRARVFSLVRAESHARVWPSFLGEDAIRALERVSRPLPEREISMYRLEDLVSYRPNQTFLLKAHTRERLHGLGREQGTEDLPAGTVARRVYERLLIDLSYASSHLEGNTYSLLDTARLIEEGVRAKGKTALEATMILNHKAAIEGLIQDIELFTLERIPVLSLHAALSDGLLRRPEDEGRLRNIPVQVTGTRYTPLAVPAILEEAFETLLALARQIEDPFEQSFFCFVHLMRLQPFVDVNKRTARLVANIPLIRDNLCPISFRDIERELYALATLAFYEDQDAAALEDLYVFAYERSVIFLRGVSEQLQVPDTFRLEHRVRIHELVRWLARQTPKHPEAALELELEDLEDPVTRARLIGITLSELGRLHEGTLWRYRLTSEDHEALRLAYPRRVS